MASNYFAIPTVASAPGEKFPVIVLGPDVGKDVRLAAMAGILSALSKKCPDPNDAVKIVYALHILAFPESSSHLSSLQSLTPEILTLTTEDLQAWAMGDESVPNTVVSSRIPLPGPVKPEALGNNHEVAIYAGYASVIFSIARQASDKGATAASDNRPKALIARFDIPDSAQDIFPGRANGPAIVFLEQVYNAFANLPEPRNKIVTYLLGMKTRGGYYTPVEEVVMTNFRLMEGAGMTHVTAILDLCRMYPWVVKVPTLRPYFSRFQADLEKFSSVPETVRRYHRLLVPQSEYLFLSSDLRPLIAVAGSFLEEVEKNFGGYVYNKADYQELIDSVHSRKPLAVNATALSGLLDALQIPDEPLPEMNNKNQSTTRLLQ